MDRIWPKGSTERLRKIAWALCILISMASLAVLNRAMAQSKTEEANVDVSPTKPAVANGSKDGVDSGSQSDTVPSCLLQIPVSSNFYSPFAFVVDKTARTLTVWQQSPSGLKEVAHFPADLGKNTGEKRAQGDHKTPEGIYFLLEKLETPAIDFKLYGNRAFTTDYPNFFDRAEGKTGGGIWLHAVPDHVPLTRGSRGCVVVRNNVILDISQYVKLGRTPILIQDRTKLISARELSKATNEINQWLEAWRSAWETKTIDTYIAHYGDEFRSLQMNRSQWRTYKARLNRTYKTISVHISKPAILVDRDRIIVRFLQEYVSDLHADVGEKVLYLKRGANGYRIVGETWSEESSPLARQEIEAAKNNTTTATLSCLNSEAPECGRSAALPQ